MCSSAVVGADCKYFEFSSSWNKVKLELGRVGMSHMQVNFRGQTECYSGRAR